MAEVKTYEHDCRSCGSPMLIDEETQKHYENNQATGKGFTMPKCWRCWA